MNNNIIILAILFSALHLNRLYDVSFTAPYVLFMVAAFVIGLL